MSRERAGASGGNPGAGDTGPSVRIELADPAAGLHLLPELDAVLVGFLARDDPATAVVTEDWIEAPKWQQAARALLRHRRAGGTLGDIFLATKVLEEADVEFAATITAEALLAVAEVAGAAHIIAQARERLPRLRLRRLADLLLVTASSEPAAIARICRGVAPRTLEQIASEAEPC